MGTAMKRTESGPHHPCCPLYLPAYVGCWHGEPAMMMVIQSAGRDCANLPSGVVGLACTSVSFGSVPKGLFSGLHKSQIPEAIAVRATMVRPLLTSLFHTASTCLANVLCIVLDESRTHQTDASAVLDCFVHRDPSEPCTVEQRE